MQFKLIKNSLFFVFAMLIQFTAIAEGTISGDWMHASKPAVIKIDLQTGIASIKTHNLNKEAEGLTLIKEIARSERSKQEWVGNMFNGYEGRYEPITIKYVDEKEIAVFNATNAEVLRLIRE